MNSRYHLFLVLLLLGCPLSAQTLSQSEKQAMQETINMVKMSQQVIYADNYDNALTYDKNRCVRLAEKKLRQQLQAMLLNELGLIPVDPHSIEEYVTSNIHFKERNLKDGVTLHLFAWMTKEDIIRWTTTEGHLFQHTNGWNGTPALYEMDSALRECLEELQDGKTKAVSVQTQSTVEATTTAQNQPVAEMQPEVPVKPVLEQHKEIQSQTKVEIFPDPSPLIKEIMAAKVFSLVTKLLTQKQKAGLLEWGNVKAMEAHLTECQVIVIDNQSKEIITVLGEGSNDRVDYVNKKHVSDSEYAAYPRIYFLEKK